MVIAFNIKLSYIIVVNLMLMRQMRRNAIWHDHLHVGMTHGMVVLLIGHPMHGLVVANQKAGNDIREC